jgi:hypothetical protein
MLQYGKRDVMKQAQKMSQSGCFVTIQVKKRVVILSQLHYIHPWSVVDIKSLDVPSGDEMSQGM